MLNDKIELRQTLLNFFSLVHRQFNGVVKTVCCDNETEFVCLNDWLREIGTIHQTLCVETPERNERVERKHYYILSVPHALCFQANFPIKFWVECVLTVVYLLIGLHLLC